MGFDCTQPKAPPEHANKAKTEQQSRSDEREEATENAGGRKIATVISLLPPGSSSSLAADGPLGPHCGWYHEFNHSLGLGRLKEGGAGDPFAPGLSHTLSYPP